MSDSTTVMITDTVDDDVVPDGDTFTADQAAAAAVHGGDDVLVPVLTGPQRQGDVFVWPAGSMPATTPTGDTRDVHPAVDVIDGGTARNNHTLVAAKGAASWTPTRDAEGLAIGILTVADSEVAYLSHDEHQTLGIGPGAYIIRRQREQAAVEQRLVAD